MNAAELVALASAHGIDFIRVAGGSNRTDGVASRRRKVVVEICEGITQETRRKQRMEAPDTAKGKGSRVAKSPAYSQAELGIAAEGVSMLAWSAAQHTIANDRSTLTLRVLHSGLMSHAVKFAKQFSWEVMLPGWIPRDEKGKRIAGAKRESVYYREALCMLVLDEISFRPAFTPPFGTDKLYAIYLGVEQETWEKILLERFKLLQMRYAVWYGSGLRLIQQRINGTDGEQRGAA